MFRLLKVNFSIHENTHNYRVFIRYCVFFPKNSPPLSLASARLLLVLQKITIFPELPLPDILFPKEFFSQGFAHVPCIIHACTTHTCHSYNSICKKVPRKGLTKRHKGQSFLTEFRLGTFKTYASKITAYLHIKKKILIWCI